MLHAEKRFRSRFSACNIEKLGVANEKVFQRATLKNWEWPGYEANIVCSGEWNLHGLKENIYLKAVTARCIRVCWVDTKIAAMMS